ncbi:MAG: hypothetical protein AAF702_43645 [Chloroflexota bacterium]
MVQRVARWGYMVFTLMLMLLSGCVMLETGSMTVADDSSAGSSEMVMQRVLMQDVRTHASRGDVTVVDGASAQIVHTGDGVLMNFDTAQLTPGNVYTAWWVFINDPSGCETIPCTPKDVLGNSDAVVSDLGYADGLVADENGHGSFSAYQPLGELSNAWIGNGFSNLGGAEIHVINEHGPLVPEMAEDMLSSYRGGCTDESIPAPFPDTARADGTPGSSPCQLFQFAIFLPQDVDVEMVEVATQVVSTHASRGDVTEVADAGSLIARSDDGLFMSFDTGELTPGNVYTAWWVFINDPSSCETIPCTPKDVLGNPDVVVSDLGYADGLIADADGNGHFVGYQPLGDLSNAWIGNGFSNLDGAEVHVIINEHGPALVETLDDMLSSYRGGCTDESIPAPFPDTARADGIPGPNPCQLYQFAIFVP